MTKISIPNDIGRMLETIPDTLNPIHDDEAFEGALQYFVRNMLEALNKGEIQFSDTDSGCLSRTTFKAFIATGLLQLSKSDHIELAKDPTPKKAPKFIRA